jgi:hypothetical protein
VIVSAGEGKFAGGEVLGPRPQVIVGEAAKPRVTGIW